MPENRVSPRPADHAETLLAELFRAGVRVSVAGDGLRCSGPPAVLNGPLGARIRADKPALLAFLRARDRDPEPPVAPLAAVAPPLSAAQRRLWTLERLRPDAAHHIPFALEARGALDPGSLERALSRIMARHETLRARIAPGEDGPRQRISDAARPPIREEDASGLSDAEIGARIAQEVSRPFDLSAEPPLRLLALRKTPQSSLLIFTLHHIAADGGSVAALMAEFGALYGATGAPLPNLPVQYGDYAAWRETPQQRARAAAQMAFWKERLGDGPPVTRLPGDFPRPVVQSLRAKRQALRLPRDLVGRLRVLGAARGASLFAVLLTGFYALISRYTGERDLIVGTPAANRPAGTRNLIGLFVNPLPLRSRIEPGAGFAENLDRVRAGLLAALDHAQTPFEDLVEAFQPIRDPGASALFQLKFQLDRAPSERLDLPGVVLTRRPLGPGAALHDLTLDLVESDDGVSGQIDYCADLFRPETIAALADHYRRLLTSAVGAPDKPLALLEMLSPEETRRQLADWNDSAVPLDPAARFPALFEAHAAARPDAPAVEHFGAQGRRVESYGALNARANRLAHALRARGLGPDAVVAIALERGPEMVAAWLGVLKSGAAYLPLDPAYPPGRLAWMLRDSGAALALTQSDIPTPAGVERWELDRIWPDGCEDDPAPGAEPEDLAYLIYTSGSTGRPKGVEVPHAGLVNLARSKIAACDVGPGDRVMGFFSFSFDASIPDLVMSLGAGARLITAPGEALLPGPGFAALLRESGATHLTITPSALAATPEADLPDLRMVLVGGESPAPELIARWGAGRLFINAYGPTECTVNASMTRCVVGAAPELRAPANKRLYVLDEALQLLPAGCPGELCVAGTGLARGYRGLPGRTAQAFVPDPFCKTGGRLYRTGDRAVRDPDGGIRVLGRIDDQVKIRGFRVEPGETARACEAHPAIAAAAVAARDVGGAGLRLVAWLVAKAPEAERPDMRADLAQALPRHLVPDFVVWRDSLPLTVNGKLDLRALPDPEPRGGSGRAPQGPTETALAEIYAALLGVERPGAEDDFFDLGGDSLKATRLVAMIEDRLGARIRALDLFEASSIKALARRIDAPEAAPVRKQKEEWREDVVLPADIAPPAPPAASRAAHGLGDCVLLSGATGFVGVYLLAGLLAAPQRRALCLTRRGAAALRDALTARGLWREDFAGRIDALEGDLSAEGWGLRDADRARCRAQATSVLHCGAAVRHLSPYRALRAANVGGTVAALRLAAQAGVALHHISTLSALAPGAAPLTEAVPAAGLDPPEGGYNLSKWAAERLVAEAGARGLPVTIHRLGSVAGDSRSGAFNDADILATRLRGYLALGAAPAGEALINLLPVDHVARAVLHLAERPESVGGVFHLTHSRPVPAGALFAACAAEGRPIRRVPAAEWRALTDRIARDDPDHPLRRLAALGGPEGFGGAVWPYDNAATRAALGPDLPEPDIDAALLRRYVRAALEAMS